MGDPVITAVGMAAKKVVESNRDEQSELEKLEGAALDFTLGVTGSAKKELGAWFADHVRVRRLKSQMKILEKAQGYVSDAGLDAKQVKMNLIVPLLETGSLEEDESMQERWAALLENAATEGEDGHPEVSPGFVEVLKQMEQPDAFVLDFVHRRCSGLWRKVGVPWRTMCELGDVNDIGAEAVELIVQNLERLGLVTYADAKLARTPRGTAEVPEAELPRPDKAGVFMTAYGMAFHEACVPPKSSEPDKVADG